MYDVIPCKELSVLPLLYILPYTYTYWLFLSSHHCSPDVCSVITYHKRLSALLLNIIGFLQVLQFPPIGEMTG